MGVLHNLGYIKQAQAYNCTGGDIAITIEAAARAGAITLFEAASFGCADIIKMRAGISPWHARNLKALINGVTSPSEKNIINKAYKFIIPVEKALFFFFVVDLTVGFFANWQSQLFKLGACDNEAQYGTGTGSNPHWICPGHKTFANVAYTEFTASGTRPGLVDHHGFIVPPGYNWTCWFSLNPRQLFGNDPAGSCDTTLREILDHPFMLTPQENKPPWLFNKLTATWTAHGHNKHTHSQEYFYVAATEEVCYADGGSLSVTVSERPLLNNGLIPVNCFGKPAPGTYNPV
jgi:hypothetical protein